MGGKERDVRERKKRDEWTRRMKHEYPSGKKRNREKKIKMIKMRKYLHEGRGSKKRRRRREIMKEGGRERNTGAAMWRKGEGRKGRKNGNNYHM